MIKGLIFDKDGTLFDFNATWGAWAGRMIAGETAGNPAKTTALANAMGYDMENQRFRPASVVIAATVEETASAMLTVLTDETHDTLIPRMNAAASAVEQVQAVPLIPFFDDLRARGLALGIATNDAEAPALANLTSAGVHDHFHFIAGYDSGHGAKPGTGQLDAFCRETGLAPHHCAMIGDSTHDLQAGRAAGMTTIGVLTGPAPSAELAPLADVVLPDIGHIPAWLDARS
ncbi:HAD family hydrolase [Cognatiyoonia sp. IB215446]|uniref:HAD family hydrolase n=1 Tax=Cognatiyoonia sp. IB215446 TaxID=3097355 RepID=UPI002A0C83AF|nr:HAD family hydrolase [Cognatiyoonia sp. IB215446]MDX8348051.1 HAD family hydrolase [Cognatiyoonia sp. IB215446]